jgi:hypothetical protein
MAKSVVVFDHSDGKMEVIPLEPGGFLVMCEDPMRLDSRTDRADGSVTLVLKKVIVPPSIEGIEMQNAPSEAPED